MKEAIKATDYVITFLCILEKVKQEMQKTDQWLPGTGWEEGLAIKGHRDFFWVGDGTVLYFGCGSGFMTMYLLKLIDLYTKKG